MCQHEWSTYGFQYPRSRRCEVCGEVRHDVTMELDRRLGQQVDSDRWFPSRWRWWHPRG